MDLLKYLAHDFCVMSLGSGRAIVGVGPFKKQAEPSETLPSFYLQDFYLQEPMPWLVPKDAFFCDLRDFEQCSSLPHEVAPTFEAPDFRTYAEVFEAFQHKFETGEIVKAVPVMFERSQAVLKYPQKMLSAFAGLSGSLHAYACRIDDLFVCGASPELLFRKNKASFRMSSEAVAGTTASPQAERLVEELHFHKEHALVVEDISQRLSLFGQVHISSVSLQPYPGLMHLRAELSLDVNEKTRPQDIIHSLHPTGAVGILPRSSPFSYTDLKTLDPMNCRGIYAAPFGVSIPATTVYESLWRFTVMIRNVQQRADGLFIGSGGGLIASSQLGEEWSELESKRRSVKKLFLRGML